MSANTPITRLNKILRRALGCFVGISILLFSGLSKADPGYKPIEKIEHLSSYFLFTRCAGLMTAVSYWMGADAKDKDLQTSIMEDAKLFTALAILDGFDSNVSIENLRSQAVQQVKVSRDMYLGRFKENYAGGGQGYGDDKEVKSDILLCRYAKESISSK